MGSIIQAEGSTETPINNESLDNKVAEQIVLLKTPFRAEVRRELCESIKKGIIELYKRGEYRNLKRYADMYLNYTGEQIEVEL